MDWTNTRTFRPSLVRDGLTEGDTWKEWVVRWVKGRYKWVKEETKSEPIKLSSGTPAMSSAPTTYFGGSDSIVWGNPEPFRFTAEDLQPYIDELRETVRSLANETASSQSWCGPYCTLCYPTTRYPL